MTNIFPFRLKTRPTREQAVAWLGSNSHNLPSISGKDISEDLFHGWRLVRAMDGKIYFADCISRGICESEFRAQEVG